MKFLLDANLPQSLVGILKRKYKVSSRRAAGSLSDPQIYHRCRQENRVLLTLDTDFLNILRYPPNQHPGIVVFRLSNQSLRHVMASVVNFFETFKGRMDVLYGSVVVVREDRFKIYPRKTVG